MIQFSELEKQVIERYLGKQDYVVRIRLDDKTKKKLDIKVYYEGRKVFDVSGNKFVLDSSYFFKKKKEFKMPDEECIEKLTSLGFKFTIGSVLKSSNEFYHKRYKYRLKVEASSAGETSEAYYDKNKDKIDENMSKILELVKTYFKDTVRYFDEETKCNNFYINATNNEISYYNLQNILNEGLKLTLNQSGIKKIDIGEKIVCDRKSFTESEYDILEEVIRERIKAYNTGKIIEDLVEENDEDIEVSLSEKTYQQILMNKMFDVNQREKLLEVKNCPFKGSTAFEMEYMLYAENRENKVRSTKKGRVDNIFINGNEVIFTEIKFDEDVIDGTNGIHKHLIDLINGFNGNDEALSEVYDYVCDYNEVLENFESKEHLIINGAKRYTEEECEREFVIICGYSKGNDNNVLNKIKTVYQMTGKEAGVLKEYKFKDKKLEELFCYELVDILKNEFNCNVNIYLVDDGYTKFDNLMNELNSMIEEK